VRRSIPNRSGDLFSICRRRLFVPIAYLARYREEFKVVLLSSHLSRTGHRHDISRVSTDNRFISTLQILRGSGSTSVASSRRSHRRYFACYLPRALFPRASSFGSFSPPRGAVLRIRLTDEDERVLGHNRTCHRALAALCAR